MTLLIVQTIYYFLTGIWPILSIRTFFAVTGPKNDVWLVKTVGAIVTAISLAFGYAAAVGRISPEIKVLAITCGIAFIAIDTYYVACKNISKVYVVDAVIHMALVLLWIFVVPAQIP
jgi:hypothetical protein